MRAAPRGRRRPRAAPAPTGRRLALRASGDRGDLEALRLEIQRLARAHGVELEDIRIERLQSPPARRSR